MCTGCATPAGAPVTVKDTRDCVSEIGVIVAVPDSPELFCAESEKMSVSGPASAPSKTDGSAVLEHPPPTSTSAATANPSGKYFDIGKN